MRKFCYVAIATLVAIGLIGGGVLAKSDKSSESAWLGVYSQTVDKDLAEAFDLPIDYGVVVNEVIDDSPAERAGLQEDDIIIAFNGTKITDQDDLVEMIEDSRPGDKIILLVMRDNEELELPVILKKRPSDEPVWAGKKPRTIDKKFFYSFQSDDERSYIGVNLMDLSKQLGDFFGVEKGKGALITEVHEDSPAEEAGLKAGDVIVAIDDEKVIDAEDVQELIEDYEPGEKIDITIIRNKKKSTISVEVGEAEDAHYSYSYKLFTDPDILFAPKLKRLLDRPLPGTDYRFDLDFELEDFQEELEELREELESLQEELEELRQQLKQ